MGVPLLLMRLLVLGCVPISHDASPLVAALYLTASHHQHKALSANLLRKVYGPDRIADAPFAISSPNSRFELGKALLYGRNDAFRQNELQRGGGKPHDERGDLGRWQRA